MLQKIKNLILNHKIISIIIFIIILIGVYYKFIKSNLKAEVRYVTDTVQKGNIMSTITGTGQVEASDTIDLKPNASGTINYIGVNAGDFVKKGKLIASVDSRDAKLSLETAQLTLDKLVGAPDSLTLLQKQNTLSKSYDDGWNNVSSFVTNTNSMLNDIYKLYINDGYLGNSNTIGLSSAGKDKVASALVSFYKAKSSVDDLTQSYKNLSRSSSEDDIKNLIIKAHTSAQILANSLKETESTFNYVVDALNYQNSTNTTTTRTSITSWLNTANNDVNSLLSSSNSLSENNQSLSDLLAGPTTIDLKSAQLSVESKQNAYNDCFVYAPFDGVIATLTAKVGQSSGTSIGTLITKQKLATISLNEVDIAKIKLDQKVTLTFDAIDELTITGKVAQIDSIGTVSQGVVSYNVKISFDVDDTRVKPGMSVSAMIITDIAQDILVIPNTAIKTQNGTSYVEAFDSPLAVASTGIQGSTSLVLPKQIPVVIGLTNDTSSEITSGLKEGDIIVTRTITGTTTTAKSTTPSLLNAVGGNSRGSVGGATNRVIRVD